MSLSKKNETTSNIEEKKGEEATENVSFLTKIYASSINATLMKVAETSLNWMVGNKDNNIFWNFNMPQSQNKNASDKTLIALTIDDAPGYNLDGIVELLDFLKEQDVKVTFFIISSMIKNPNTNEMNESAAKIVRRMLSDGHELANHAVIDKPLKNLTESEYYDAIKECEDAILLFDEHFNDKDRIKWYRPPSAIMTKTQYKVLTKINYKIAMASKYGLDTENVECTKYLRDFYTNNMQNGDLMVMHTPDKRVKRYPLIYAIKQIIIDLKTQKKGIQFGTLSTLYHRSTESTEVHQK